MAVVSQRDQDHERAKNGYSHLIQGNFHLYTSSWTLYEAYSHIKEREKGGGLSAAEYLRNLVSESMAITVLPVTEDVEERSTVFFWGLQDKSWSITTCANILLIRDLGLIFVLSANHHYRQAGLTNLI